jgi:hypothetical protein
MTNQLVQPASPCGVCIQQHQPLVHWNLPIQGQLGLQSLNEWGPLRTGTGASVELSTTIHNVQDELCSHPLLAQECQMFFYDKYSHNLLNFEEGDQVWLKKNGDFRTDHQAKNLITCG